MADMDSFCMGDGMVMQKGFQKSPGGMCILWLFEGNIYNNEILNCYVNVK